MVKKDLTTKIGIYGTNFLTPSLMGIIKGASNSSIVNTVSNASNPYGALVFGVLDLVGGLSPKLKNSKFTRLIKFGGAIVYGAKSVGNIFSIANGDYNSLIDLPFNASMTYQLGKDTYENYNSKDLLEDVVFWKK